MHVTPQRLLRILEAITAEEMPGTPRSKRTHGMHVAKIRVTLKDPNIVGIGISRKERQGQETGELSICFYVARKRPLSRISRRYMIPAVLASAKGEAAFTDVKEIGNFSPGYLIRSQPIESGFSVGHISGLTGTVGAIVQKDDARFLLSNSHILARNGLASKGDKILYPGTVDGGTDPTNWVATLSDFIPFVRGGAFVNEMDAALAQVFEGSLPDITYNIANAASPLTVAAVSIGMTVTLQGRSSGITSGKVLDANFHFKMFYGGVGQICFKNQVLCEHYTTDGDSGSLVLDAQTGSIVGLHFGQAEGGGSVFSPIGPIMDALNFTFVSS
ncbi:hypothetical protein [Granulicella sp. dw_53]|uniref:hypothetical protein n=1 Tax=Granulicella sp. dw_53 TaxID=2719792 RepID=UPI001BD2674C|nr:hypothetical protein [Granulicella sp. dw_53]